MNTPRQHLLRYERISRTHLVDCSLSLEPFSIAGSFVTVLATTLAEGVEMSRCVLVAWVAAGAASVARSSA